MKKLIIAVTFVTILASCGDKKKETTEDVEINPADTSFTKTEAVKPEIAAEFKKGADLIASNDCLGCHKIDEKLVGPSYKEVAAKYSAKDEAMLVTKIIEGGKGNWGEIPMTAHEGISKEDATQMVKYIISLK
ncbi:c-type cytochrome [Flavobacterium sp.]|uniref:c-type cytochrome n=1 Tax=Flavobacterium sp. TaxID=239 RepID=UPI003750EB77